MCHPPPCPLIGGAGAPISFSCLLIIPISVSCKRWLHDIDCVVWLQIMHAVFILS